MQAELIKQLMQSSTFIELYQKRRRARTLMVVLMMLVFLTTQLIWAFFPDIIGVRIPADSSVSLGVWFTVLVVLTAIGLSGYYSLVMGREQDKLNEKLMREINHENK
ncbi:MAG: DUF485 domain-containing protein [Gammaproteobacteria bacterium]|nr:DUF485 domain-containing protein [Gammaproteobacteria bacterium]